jgi:hypothetical protein
VATTASSEIEARWNPVSDIERARCAVVAELREVFELELYNLKSRDLARKPAPIAHDLPQLWLTCSVG